MRTTMALALPVAAIALAVGGFATSSGAAVSSTPSAAVSPGLAVTGFQEEGDPNSRIATSAAALTTVGIDGVSLRANGTDVGTPDHAARKALAVTHHNHLRGEFLVGNFARTDFAEKRAHRMLTSASDIASVVHHLVHSTTSQGWDGISIDIESLRQRDQHGLVNFLAALKAALPTGKTVSICISSSQTDAQYQSRGYDLPGIAANVDRIILMAYDEHGTWENRPGPVGDLAWQKRGLAAMEATGVLPAQIDLGQAGYGYAWRPHQNRQVSDAQARALVAKDHGTSHFDASVGEWTANLPDGSTIWWADARSYRLRARLARHDGLHGLAVWSLGLSDPIS